LVVRVNPNASVRVESARGVPILFIDDFYLDPDEVRSDAMSARYDLSVAGYPGRHAVIPAEEFRPIAHAIAEIATRLGDRIYRPEDFQSDFSIVTTRPQDLLPSQQHPHVDPGPVLGLVYLTPGSREGTSFYFNELLGRAALITEEDRRAHERFLKDSGESLAPEGYDFEGHSVWRKLYTIDPQYNRFVLYPGNVFHAIDIKHIDEEIVMSRVRITQRILVNRTHPK
jgi:hypothetical protein